ncbi:MAG TPA: radical SAM protein, partial [Sedimentibacter sp.]|nr:radical SAM protein [Sedimentibacter sp.]
NLKQMGKSANIKNIEYDRIIKKIYDAGMMIYGTFVIGYDYDNKDSAMELAEFAMKNSFAIANFNPLMAMPGTRLYDRLKDENRLTCDDWWTNENFRYGDAMLYPRGMTGEDLQKGCKNARYLFSSYKSIFKRLFCKANFRSLSNAYLYLALNIISHIQIKNKQGRKLGGIYEDYTD